MGQKNIKAYEEIQDEVEKQQIKAQMLGSEYLKISTQVSSSLGSMFVVVRDEPAEFCEYRIVNKCSSIDLLYRQYHDRSKVPQRLSRLDVTKIMQNNHRLKSNQESRYCWSSVLHEK
jgi:hypothetical protein